jgi:hypothetical protein
LGLDMRGEACSRKRAGSRRNLDEQIGDLVDAHPGCHDRRLENVTIRELSRERIAGSCFPWICDISFLSVSTGMPS